VRIGTSAVVCVHAVVLASGGRVQPRGTTQPTQTTATNARPPGGRRAGLPRLHAKSPTNNATDEHTQAQQAASGVPTSR